jgi:hypothetical protein
MGTCTPVVNAYSYALSRRPCLADRDFAIPVQSTFMEVFNVLNQPIWAATAGRTYLKPTYFRIPNSFG